VGLSQGIMLPLHSRLRLRLQTSQDPLSLFRSSHSKECRQGLHFFLFSQGLKKGDILLVSFYHCNRFADTGCTFFAPTQSRAEHPRSFFGVYGALTSYLLSLICVITPWFNRTNRPIWLRWRCNVPSHLLITCIILVSLVLL
jgi:hypothetical protein